MTNQETLKLALDALTFTSQQSPGVEELIDDAIKALEEALKQEQGEPVAMQMDVIVVNLVREGINKHRARELAEHFIKHTKPQPSQKQEPILQPDGCYHMSLENNIQQTLATEIVHNNKIIDKSAAIDIATALGWEPKQEQDEPVAWIEHHKGGDNLNWEEVNHPYAKATPLYTKPSQKPLTDDELDICRQWFECVQDVNGGYLNRQDYALAEKLYGHLGLRVTNGVK